MVNIHIIVTANFISFVVQFSSLELYLHQVPICKYASFLLFDNSKKKGGGNIKDAFHIYVNRNRTRHKLLRLPQAF
jgi:hypothetical protein